MVAFIVLIALAASGSIEAMRNSLKEIIDRVTDGYLNIVSKGGNLNSKKTHLLRWTRRYIGISGGNRCIYHSLWWCCHRWGLLFRALPLF